MGTRLAWVLLAVGAWLRLTGLEVHSLWYDEGTTVFQAKVPAWSDWMGHLRDNRHPPLSFLFFRAWIAIGGQSDAWLRLGPALVGCGSMLLFRGLARRVTNERAGLLGLAVFALSPFQIWHAQEVRMYALLEFAALIALWGTALEPARKRTGMLCCALGVHLAVGTHYMGVLVFPGAVALGSWMAWRSGGWSWLAARVAALAFGLGSWGIWVINVVPDQLAAPWGHQARTSLIDLVEFPVRQVLVEVDALQGPGRDLTWLGYLSGAVILLALAAAVLAALRDRRSSGLGGLLLLGAPVATALLLALFMPPNFTPKYLIVAAPGTALAIGAGLASVPNAWLRGGLVAVLLSGCVVLTARHRAGNHREDYRAACADVRAAWEPGDGIVVVTGTLPGHSEETVRHYLRNAADLLGAVQPFEEHAADRAAGAPGPRRVHVVYREADYAQAQLEALLAERSTIARSPVRFRIQWLLLGP